MTTFIAESPISKRPLDVEVTPNGLVAVVRGHAPTENAVDGLTFVDTSNGDVLMKTNCAGAAGRGGYFYGPFPFDYQPSDSLRVTNSRAILVGARDTDGIGGHDSTYIDVLEIDMSGQTPTIRCLAHHEEGLVNSNQIAGWTNDVELTPDESLAIVNSSNWIHVIDMNNGAIAQTWNIGSAPFAGVCGAGDSVDSVVATNERAVVTTTRISHSTGQWNFTRTWVYILDLTAANLPYEHELTGSLPTTDRDFWPHDVTITPNGQYAIVTANNAVAVYDLPQRSFLARHQFDVGSSGDDRRRFFSDIVDSVEATNDWFVTLSTDQDFYFPPNDPPNGQCQGVPDYESNTWIVDVYALPPNSTPDMTPRRTFSLEDDPDFEDVNYQAFKCYPTYNDVPWVNDKPHDLAIAEGEGMAVIRTYHFNLVITGLNDTNPNNISLWKYLDFEKGVVNNSNAANTFVSDSVIIPPGWVKHVPQNPPGSQGVFHYALTLGAEWKNIATPPAENWRPWVARVNVIDLKANPPGVVHTFEVKDVSAFPFIYPADLHVGPVMREFVLRNNSLPEDSGSSTGRDFVRFSLDPFGELARIGGRGRVWAVDGIEVGRFNATSVGEDPSSGLGFVHVTRVQ